MTETPVPIPPDVTDLHIVCRLGRIAADGPDPQTRPDWDTQGGTVRLVPGAHAVRTVETDGRSRWHAVQTIDALIVPETGELMHQGVVGVWVTDPASAGIDPRLWSWTAHVTPTIGDPWQATFSADSAVGGTVDLAALPDMPSTAAVAGLTDRVHALESIDLAAGTVTSLPPGSTPTASITRASITSPQFRLDLGLVDGPPGVGPATVSATPPPTPGTGQLWLVTP